MRKVEDPEWGPSEECAPTSPTSPASDGESANRSLEEELRKQQAAASLVSKEGFFRENGREVLAEKINGVQAQEPVSHRVPSPKGWDAAELREDLQHQLQEIRQEVTRCARALQEPAAIPADEVLDIRQQLEALGEEVQQTSRAVAGRDLRELDEVRQQLEAIQRQVSSTLAAAWSRPAEPPKPVNARVWQSQPEISELRAEVNSLRAQLGQLSSKERPAPPDWKRHVWQRRHP
eukprot:g22794.t1